MLDGDKAVIYLSTNFVGLVLYLVKSIYSYITCNSKIT